MKGLYIVDIDFYRNPEMKGVRKKISGQLEGFKNMGVDIDIIENSNNDILMNGKKTGINIGNIKKNYINYNLFFNKIKKFNFIKYDFIYIRFSMANYGYLKFIRYCYDLNIKVFIEIPTYPYIEEMPNNINNKIKILLDKYIWRKTSKYIYRIVMTRDDIKNIHNVKTVGIFNAVNKKDVLICNEKREDDDIILIGVANISNWHGYDRLIKGMKKYYSDGNSLCNEKVRFLIIGEGIEKENLQRMTNELELNEYVEFLGSKFGDELERLYQKSHIGVSSLALFRAGGGHDPIKTKEYVAKGIPVIIGYDDRVLSKELDFIFSVSEDETYINVRDILNKYKSMKSTSAEITKYALDNLTWDAQIKKIIAEL